MIETTHKPKELAKSWRIAERKIIAWIKQGRLKAFNVGTSDKPQFRITDSAARAFQESQQPQPKPVVSRRKLPPIKQRIEL